MPVSISVAMAVYNGLPYLPAQMASVLAELQAEDELIVVDDQSTDGSHAWLQGLRDPRVTLTRNEHNLGVRGSFERALGACTRPVVFLCDQDDLWLPGKRQAMLAAFESDPQCTVVVSDAQVIDAEGKVSAPSFMATRGGFKGGWWATLVKNRYLGCCMALRREIVELGLPIPPKSPMHDMWFGLLGAGRGRVCYLPQPYLQYRRHGKNATPSSHAGVGTDAALALGLAHAGDPAPARTPPGAVRGPGPGRRESRCPLNIRPSLATDRRSRW